MPGTKFSPKTLQCMKNEELKILNLFPEKQTVNRFICPYPGFFTNTEDCQKYYVCEKNQAVGEIRSCSPGHYFNEQKKFCTNIIPLDCFNDMHKNLQEKISRAHLLRMKIRSIVNKIRNVYDKWVARN